MCTQLACSHFWCRCRQTLSEMHSRYIWCVCVCSFLCHRARLSVIFHSLSLIKSRLQFVNNFLEKCFGRTRTKITFFHITRHMKLFPSESKTRGHTLLKNLNLIWMKITISKASASSWWCKVLCVQIISCTIAVHYWWDGIDADIVNNRLQIINNSICAEPISCHERPPTSLTRYF